MGLEISNGAELFFIIMINNNILKHFKIIYNFEICCVLSKKKTLKIEKKLISFSKKIIFTVLHYLISFHI
jgi:hypothetical protein